MPYSSPEGKQWIRDQVAQIRPGSVLDIGAGAGTYGGLLRHDSPDAHFTAIEVWVAYVPLYDLAAKYDTVIVADVVTMDELPAADVVVFGDVLEHLDHDDAVRVWGMGRHAARRAVFLSIPIIEYPQGPVGGNPYEEHRVTWSHEMVLDNLVGIVEHQVHGEIGVYRAGPA